MHIRVALLHQTVKLKSSNTVILQKNAHGNAPLIPKAQTGGGPTFEVSILHRTYK